MLPCVASQSRCRSCTCSGVRLACVRSNAHDAPSLCGQSVQTAAITAVLAGTASALPFYLRWLEKLRHKVFTVPPKRRLFLAPSSSNSCSAQSWAIAQATNASLRFSDRRLASTSSMKMLCGCTLPLCARCASARCWIKGRLKVAFTCMLLQRTRVVHIKSQAAA